MKEPIIIIIPDLRTLQDKPNVDRQIRETIIKICENLSDNYTVEIVEEGRNAPTSISGKGVEVIEELKKFQEDLEKREGW